MNINDLLVLKNIKPKERTELLSGWILNHTIDINEVIELARREKDSVKTLLIESIEFATRQNAGISNEKVLEFAVDALASKSPSVKRESGRVIANIARLYPEKLDKAIVNLIENSEHPGTVVRWSAALAIGEILKLKTIHNQQLVPAAHAICEKEEKNSIRKIYLAALKNT